MSKPVDETAIRVEMMVASAETKPDRYLTLFAALVQAHPDKTVLWAALAPGEANALCAAAPKNGGDLTAAELLVACRNIGFDLTCGACAGLFYTGAALGEHSCDQPDADDLAYETYLKKHAHDLCLCGHSLGAHDGYGDTPTMGRCKHCECQNGK